MLLVTAGEAVALRSGLESRTGAFSLQRLLLFLSGAVSRHSGSGRAKKMGDLAAG